MEDKEFVSDSLGNPVFELSAYGYFRDKIQDIFAGGQGFSCKFRVYFGLA